MDKKSKPKPSFKPKAAKQGGQYKSHENGHEETTNKSKTQENGIDEKKESPVVKKAAGNGRGSGSENGSASASGSGRSVTIIRNTEGRGRGSGGGNESRHVHHSHIRNAPKYTSSNNQPQNNSKKPVRYQPHMTIEQVEAESEDGSIVFGVLAVTKYAHSIAFIRNPLFAGGDIIVDGWAERNRALPGDVVAVKLNPIDKWLPRQRVHYDDDNSEVGYPTPKRPKNKPKVDPDANRRRLQETLGKDVPEFVLREPPKDWDTTRQPTGFVVAIIVGRPELTSRQIVCRLIPGPGLNQTQSIATPPTQPAPPVAVDKSDSDEEEQEGEVILFRGLARDDDDAQPPPSTPPIRAPTPLASPSPIQSVKFVKPKTVMMRPDDESFPFITIPTNTIPDHVEPEEWGNYLYLIQLTKWLPEYQFPQGEVNMFLGKLGTIEAESAALLRQFDVCTEPFSEDILEECEKPFVIPSPKELKRQNRRDLREEEFCVTIDPVTAKDLDDALSCTRLPNGLYRIGVHIADVSHFVEAGSATDDEAKKRCTTVYLVQKAIPMLPRILSEDYCSLNAGSDKFAFSIIWTMNKNGEIKSEWMGKSVIRNQCKLSYPIAQKILDGVEEDSDFVLPPDVSEHKRQEIIQQIKKGVIGLNEVALNLRKARSENGAVKLNRPKLGFVFPKLVDEGGDEKKEDDMRFAPTTLFLYKTQASNHLVEEYMLLANMKVAEKLVRFLPLQALVRRHGGPLAKKVRQVVPILEERGFNIDMGSAQSLSRSLEALKGHPQAEMVQTIVTYCMQLAKYCCSSDTEELGLHHFGLNVPLYTHFTSPIRRYADVIVHRSLQIVLDFERQGQKEIPFVATSLSVASALKGLEGCQQVEELLDAWEDSAKERDDFIYSSQEIDDICLNCNLKKYKAKQASDASTAAYFAFYLKSLQRVRTEQPYIETIAIVVKVEYEKKFIHLSMNEYALERDLNPKRDLGGHQAWVDITFGDKENKKCTVVWQDGGSDVIDLLSRFLVRLEYYEDKSRMGYRICVMKLLDD